MQQFTNIVLKHGLHGGTITTKQQSKHISSLRLFIGTNNISSAMTQIPISLL